MLWGNLCLKASRKKLQSNYSSADRPIKSSSSDISFRISAMLIASRGRSSAKLDGMPQCLSRYQFFCLTKASHTPVSRSAGVLFFASLAARVSSCEMFSSQNARMSFVKSSRAAAACLDEASMLDAIMRFHSSKAESIEPEVSRRINC